MSHINRLFVGLCAGLMLLSGCDSASDDEGSDLTSAPAHEVNDAEGGLSGTNSDLDGQPIQILNASSLATDPYAAQVRSAIAARGAAIMDALPRQGAYVLLKSVLDGADVRLGRQAAPPLSTHFRIVNGTQSQDYALAFAPPESGVTGFDYSKSPTQTYIVLDPAVLHPHPSTGEDTYPRDVLATNLSTGAAAKVTLEETGFKVDGDPAGQLLVIEAVPVIDEINPAYPDYLAFGEPLPASEMSDGNNNFNGSTTLTFLSLRQLRIDRSFDGGGISGKNEVQFTAQPTDDYNLEFPRYNTRRFDNAFWTNLFGPNPEWATSNTLNPHAWAPYQVLWFRATDVNYASTDYSFTKGDFYDCDYYVPAPYSCIRKYTTYDFPVVQLTASNIYYRAYMNEDDWGVSYLSRRSGDWRGNIRTVNFSTGGFETRYTKLDANNHALVSSDDVFTESGVRRVNNSTVNSRTNNGAQTFTSNSNGLKYVFSKQGITF